MKEIKSSKNSTKLISHISDSSSSNEMDEFKMDSPIFVQLHKQFPAKFCYIIKFFLDKKLTNRSDKKIIFGKFPSSVESMHSQSAWQNEKKMYF